MTGPVLVISPAPTANGDLHLGHLAGPFLAADVFTRAQRRAGRTVVFGTGVQDTSTFVVTTARRLDTEPGLLIRQSAKDVESTLTALGIEVDGFTGWEDRFTTYVAQVVSDLRATGRLRLQGMRFPYAPHTGEYLVDGHIAGSCPTCLADSCGGLCEGCGHPVAAADLLDPYSTRNPAEPIEFRTVEVLVLPLEEYRDRLRDHISRIAGSLRPRAARLLSELLARPLPDFPVTYPLSWGIAAPGLPGQVVNPNAEPVAWTRYCALVAAENAGLNPVSPQELWRPEAQSTIALFLGADNLFPFAVSGAAMLLACGDQVLPEYLFTNEFYELDREKFSTSRGHLIWGRELAARVPRDLIRFHLAGDSPELQRTSFDRSELARLTRTRLVDPWNRIVDRVAHLAGAGPTPVSDRSRADAARIADRFGSAYDLPHFSLVRAAATVTAQLGRLDRSALEGGDLYHQTEVLLRCAAPILIDLSAGLPDVGLTEVLRRETVDPMALPRLVPVED